MAYHETALDAIFEDGVDDAELEEGELMDVDGFDAESVFAEEVELVVHKPSSTAFLDGPEEPGAAENGEFNDHQANGESDPGGPPRQKKPNKKRSGKRAKRFNVAQFVRDTCRHLREKKYPLMWAAVKELGVDVVRNLIKEVDVIERCGGQMTNDGKRRRTPGGVMWNILRGRVQPAVYKEIMSQGNEVQKQKDKKTKESLKRNKIDVGEPACKKRQKLTAEEVDTSGSATSGKRINQTWQSLLPAKDFLEAIDIPQTDNSLLLAIHLQKAWMEGIRKKESITESGVVPVPSADPEFMKVGRVTAGLPDKKPLPVFERLRVPVEYSDLVTEKKSELLSQGQTAPTEHGDLVKGNLCDFRGQDPKQKGE